MARDRIITKTRFMETFKKGFDTLYEMAYDLNVTIPTVCNYLDRFGLERPPKKGAIKKAMGLFNSYKGNVKLIVFADEQGIDKQMVRYYLEMAINYQWVYGTKNQKYPRPPTLRFIKVVNALRSNGNLKRSPQKLAEITGIPILSIKKYLELMSKRKSNEKKI